MDKHRTTSAAKLSNNWQLTKASWRMPLSGHAGIYSHTGTSARRSKTVIDVQWSAYWIHWQALQKRLN